MIYNISLVSFEKIKPHNYETYTATVALYVWFCETYKRVMCYCKRHPKRKVKCI